MKGLTPVVALLAVVAVLAVVSGIAASSAAAEACPVPQLAGFNFTSLTAFSVPCPEAYEVALHVARKGSSPTDWSCSPTVAGRYVSWACVDRLIVSRKVDFTYYVL